MNARTVNDMAKKPIIGIVMGSDSDWDTMKDAANILSEFGVLFEKKSSFSPQNTGCNG